MLLLRELGSKAEVRCRSTHLQSRFQYFDMHCHLDLLHHFNSTSMSDLHLPPNFAGAIANYCYPRHYHQRLTTFIHPDIYVAVGLHPKHSHLCIPSTLHDIDHISVEDRTKAIGEIGLDYSMASVNKSAPKKGIPPIAVPCNSSSRSPASCPSCSRCIP